MRLFSLFFILLFCSGSLVAQSEQANADTKQNAVANYKKRILKSHINGIYIPMDIDDAIKTLDKIIGESGKEKFAAQEEIFAAKNVHFSFGRWIQVNWGLIEGSRLGHFLQLQGLHNIDDMAQLLMRSYHRHLNNKPLESRALIKSYIEARKNKLLTNKADSVAPMEQKDKN